MPIDQSAAQQYYSTLPESEKARVDAIGGPSVEWLQNSVNAGVPGAVQAAGGQRQSDIEGGWEAEGGYTLGRGGNTADWLGTRNPTPSELRQYSYEQGWSEDYNRYSDRQLAAWINESWDQNANMFQGGVEKPTEQGGSLAPGRGGGGGLGALARGGGGMGGPGGGGTYAGAPAYEYGEFTPPTYEEATADPGYQFALGQGVNALERSASARGTLRTGGTLRDIVDYGQQAGAQQYQNVWNRAAQGYGINRETSRDVFAPQYGSWQTQFGAGEDRWRTRYGGNLARGMQREQNIYGLLNQPPPAYPGSY